MYLPWFLERRLVSTETICIMAHPRTRRAEEACTLWIFAFCVADGVVSLRCIPERYIQTSAGYLPRQSRHEGIDGRMDRRTSNSSDTDEE